MVAICTVCSLVFLLDSEVPFSPFYSMQKLHLMTPKKPHQEPTVHRIKHRNQTEMPALKKTRKCFCLAINWVESFPADPSRELTILRTFSIVLMTELTKKESKGLNTNKPHLSIQGFLIMQISLKAKRPFRSKCRRAKRDEKQIARCLTPILLALLNQLVGLSASAPWWIGIQFSSPTHPILLFQKTMAHLPCVIIPNNELRVVRTLTLSSGSKGPLLSASYRHLERQS